MNAERLLEHYERIAEAPDAIVRLRRFVLDLAVRGKLVPQDPNDEPAKELLKRIAREKLDQIGMPQGWRRAKVGSILDFQYGKGLKATERLDGGPVPVFGSNGIVGFTDEPLTVRPSIIVGRKGSAGALNLCDGPSWTTDVAYFVEAPSFIDIRFMLNSLASLDLDKLGKGVKPGLSRSEAYDQVMPLPPPAEQNRIVAKVDELMGLCDQLEAARGTREATRDRLAAASLARLNAPDPKTFQEDVRFALDALPEITTRPDQIKAFRQTILNLAVRGKLVPQEASDEPASELLKRIAQEKARAGKREKIEAEIDNEEELGELPPTWRAVPLIALGSWAIGSGFPKNEQGLESGPHFFLKVSDMNLPGNDKYITTSNNFIDDDASRRMRAKIHPPGTVIFPKIGGAIATNKRRILTRGSAIDNNCLGITFAGELNIEWAFLLLTTLDFTRYQAGTAVPALQQGVLERILVGLPPLAEQHRIVAKVDELMALCDRLEASLTATANTRRSLLDALLAKALAPVGTRELESAE